MHETITRAHQKEGRNLAEEVGNEGGLVEKER
jgi:hypothetical protein